MKKKMQKLLIFLLIIFNFQIIYSQNKKDKSSDKLEKECKDLGKNINRILSCSIKEINKAFNNISNEDVKDFATHLKKKIKITINEIDFEQDSVNGNSNDFKIKDHFNSEKSKKINKTFKVNPSTKLDLENKFGKIQITTWDKNEIAVDINIIARANSDQKAQEILDKINVDINEGNDIIYFKTKMESIYSKGGNKSFEINYTVNMPRNNALKVKNSFGDMFLGNFNGKTDIEVKYGGLRAEKLTSNENNLKVGFGSGSITYIKNGNLNISYSDFNLSSGGNIDLTSSFSDIKLEGIDILDIKNKYGKVEIGSVNSVTGSNSFADFNLKKLALGLDMKVSYCGAFEVRNIGKNFKNININGSFSHFDLDFDDGNAFNFDVNVSYGNADIDKNKAQFNISEKKNTSAYYKGRFGKGSSQGNVNIKSSYGDVSFQGNND